MPKLPFKRTPASDPVVLDAYIPSQTVDYTVLPPLEADDAEAGLRALPTPARIALLVLPLLVVLFGAWALWGYLTKTESAPEVVLTPSVNITSARVVSSEAIMIEAQSQHVDDGTPVRAELLSNDQPVDWLDTATVTGTVQNDRISMRLQKVDPTQTLDAEAAYRVALAVGADTPLASAQSDVAVPLQLADAFFAKATPTPAPSATPAASATPTPSTSPSASASASAAPVQADTPVLDVKLDATLLISPTLDAANVVGSVSQGTQVVPFMRTNNKDGDWFLIRQMDERVAWLHAKYVSATDGMIQKIPSVKPNEAAFAGSSKATVFNGGNIRYEPNKRRGTILGQLHAGQSVSLIGKTNDGAWYHVVAPEAEGWVHVSLLTIPQDVAKSIPVE